jgi:hypothetical protein
MTGMLGSAAPALRKLERGLCPVEEGTWTDAGDAGTDALTVPLGPRTKKEGVSRIKAIAQATVGNVMRRGIKRNYIAPSRFRPIKGLCSVQARELRLIRQPRSSATSSLFIFGSNLGLL